MHPGALAGGIGALNLAFTGQALYALRIGDRRKDGEAASRRSRGRGPDPSPTGRSSRAD